MSTSFSATRPQRENVLEGIDKVPESDSAHGVHGSLEQKFMKSFQRLKQPRRRKQHNAGKKDGRKSKLGPRMGFLEDTWELGHCWRILIQYWSVNNF